PPCRNTLLYETDAPARPLPPRAGLRHPDGSTGRWAFPHRGVMGDRRQEIQGLSRPVGDSSRGGLVEALRDGPWQPHPPRRSQPDGTVTTGRKTCSGYPSTAAQLIATAPPRKRLRHVGRARGDREGTPLRHI